MERLKLTQSLKSEAQRQGFDFVGACPAVSAPNFNRFDHWLKEGRHGEMEYLETRKEAYRHPDGVMPGSKSVLMLAMNYQSQPRQPRREGTGKIARYAWGETDYHDFIHKRLKLLCRFAESLDDKIKVRGVVDTAPLLEREFGQLSGLGWSAKNTMLINKQIGSWFFLAAMLVNVELEYDPQHDGFHCGTCTACLDACPTDAFVGPHELDATKCISYLTIEHRSPIPAEIRPQMDDWILGCDVCQDVCPWNSKSPLSTLDVFQPRADFNALELPELFELSEDEFRVRFRKTPLWRPKRRGILRNAAIALGNHPSAVGLQALELGINDEAPLVRGAVAWAIGRHGTVDVKRSQALLESRNAVEEDEVVKEELASALAALNA
jgi:epoxyqueuosine reductase